MIIFIPLNITTPLMKNSTSDPKLEKFVVERLVNEEKLAAICLRLQHKGLSHEDARELTKNVALKHSVKEKNNAYLQIGIAILAMIGLIIWGSQSQKSTKAFGSAIAAGLFALYRLYKLNKRIKYLRSLN